jgi:hypothetical protein
MGMRKRCLILVFVLAIAWSTGACAFNSFETAGAIGEQVVALTFGIGLATTELGAGGTWYLVPQGRLTIGLLEGLDLGVQSGWKQAGYGAGATDWLGGLIDVKITSAYVPGMYTVAWGAGGGFGLDFLGNGWGVFLQLLYESHAPLLPVYVTYRSILPLDAITAGSIEFKGYIAGGFCLRLAPIARLLLVADVYEGSMSLGLGLETGF